MPRAGFSAVPSVRVIFCVALCVAKQYHGSPRRHARQFAANRSPVQHDEVTRRDVDDVIADRLDDAARLVAEQERKVVVDAALAIVQIGVADAAGRTRTSASPGPGSGTITVSVRTGSPLAALITPSTCSLMGLIMPIDPAPHNATSGELPGGC